MKVFATVMKVVAALAAVVGAVYVAATYGDKIVAWAKKMLGCKCGCCCDEAVVEAEETPVEEPVAEEAVEAPAEEVEEAPAVEENEVVANEADFEG